MAVNKMSVRSAVAELEDGVASRSVQIASFDSPLMAMRISGVDAAPAMNVLNRSQPAPRQGMRNDI
jgi:hypothetical protein